ncbi:MAG: tetratricopeptide repeat protein [Geminicoccaceae bacterium]
MPSAVPYLAAMMRSTFLACLLPLLLLLAWPVHGQTADDNALKGRDLMAAGKYEAAIPFLQRDLADVETAAGEGSPALAAPLNDLAEANRLAGRLDQAEKLYRRALALDERAKRKDPVGTATTMNNLALVYRQKGQLRDAERLQSQSLRLLEDTLGSKDGRVAMGLHNMAAIYREQGRLGDARPLQARAVVVAEEALGPDDPDTRRFRATLAALGDAPASHPQPVPSLPPVKGKGILPPPPIDEEPEPAPVRAGGFAVQVAAVRDAGEVSSEWRRLARKFPDLAALELQPAVPIEVKGKGMFYRVIGGPVASMAAAEALCARLVRGGASCRPTKR